MRIDKLNETREMLKGDGIKVSVNDFITKAVAHALLQCPDVNTLYKNGQVRETQIIIVNPNIWALIILIYSLLSDSENAER